MQKQGIKRKDYSAVKKKTIERKEDLLQRDVSGALYPKEKPKYTTLTEIFKVWPSFKSQLETCLTTLLPTTLFDIVVNYLKIDVFCGVMTSWIENSKIMIYTPESLVFVPTPLYLLHDSTSDQSSTHLVALGYFEKIGFIQAKVTEYYEPKVPLLFTFDKWSIESQSWTQWTSANGKTFSSLDSVTVHFFEEKIYIIEFSIENDTTYIQEGRLVHSTSILLWQNLLNTESWRINLPLETISTLKTFLWHEPIDRKMTLRLSVLFGDQDVWILRTLRLEDLKWQDIAKGNGKSISGFVKSSSCNTYYCYMGDATMGDATNIEYLCEGTSVVPMQGTLVHYIHEKDEVRCLVKKHQEKKTTKFNGLTEEVVVCGYFSSFSFPLSFTLPWYSH